MPQMDMAHTADEAMEETLGRIGDISEFQVFHNDVVVAIYIRPDRTKSGLILTDRTRDEDKYQGKVGLVVKMGAEAFNDPSGNWFQGVNVKVGDWVWFRASDGFALSINDREGLCRVLKDTSIRGTIPRPDMIW